jgi:Ni/Co efflux regulator RcnB
MTTKRLIPFILLGAALACTPALIQGQETPHQDSGAKQDMRDAGHETKNAARDAGHGVKQGTKKAYHKTKYGTKKAWHKTKSTTKGAVEGAKEGAHQPQ